MQTIISDPAGWAVTSTGFVNPTYIADTLGNQGMAPDAQGFSIENSQSIVVAFEGTYSGQTVVHQQTLDRLGLTGWFNVVGQVSTSVGDVAPTSGASTSGSAYVFPARGIRHRIQVTALASGTIIARISSESVVADMMASLVTTGTGVLAARVQGNSASGVADVGDPVKVGGKYLTAAPTFTDGQRGDIQISQQGSLLIALSGTGLGTDGGNGGVSNLLNKVGTSGNLAVSAMLVNGGGSADRPRSITGADGTGLGVQATAMAPVSGAAGALVPAVTAAVAGSLILKASAGNLYDCAITTGGSAGYLMTFNSTTVPADGAVTPQACIPIAANSGFTLDLSSAGIPERYTVGIVLVFSTTGPFTKTISATAFLRGRFV